MNETAKADPLRALIEHVAFALPGSIPTTEKAHEVAERVVGIVRHALAQQAGVVEPAGWLVYWSSASFPELVQADSARLQNIRLLEDPPKMEPVFRAPQPAIPEGYIVQALRIVKECVGGLHEWHAGGGRSVAEVVDAALAQHNREGE